LGSFSQTGHSTLHHPVQEQSLAFTTDLTAATYPSQDVPSGTDSQLDWHLPVAAMSQPVFTPELLSLNPGTEAFLNQRWDDQLFVGRRSHQSQGYIIENSEQGDLVSPTINQFHPLQSLNEDGVCQATSKT
jgi:hypothetical protein